MLRSAIYLEPEFQPWPKADWVFFQSPKAAKLLATWPDYKRFLRSYKVAALAPATAAALEELGVQVSFTGSGTETSITAKAFLDHLKKDENILMLTGDKTVGSVAKFLPAERCLTHLWYKSKLHVYDSNLKVLFLHATSPSQVEGVKVFLNKNKESQFIAMGTTTQKRLEMEEIKPILPNDFSEAALLQAIKRTLPTQ